MNTETPTRTFKYPDGSTTTLTDDEYEALRDLPGDQRAEMLEMMRQIPDGAGSQA